MLYQKHIFICNNERKAGERISCGEQYGLELVAAFKKEIKNRNLNVSMRAQRTGCIDICEDGPNVVIYPEAIFYGKVQLADVAEIVESHLQNNIPVERLRIKFFKR